MKSLKKILYLTHSSINHKLLNRSYCVKRKFPIDPSEEDKLPIFQYPKGDNSDRRIYVWGLTDTGALGIHKKNVDRQKATLLHFNASKSPSRLTFGELYEVRSLTCGYGFSVYGVKSKNSYKVFGTGLNTDSQLGYHDPRKGHPLEVLLMPAPISLPIKNITTKVINVSAGRAHLLVLTDNEGAFTLGNNAYGQCARRIIKNEDYTKASIVRHIKNINGEKIRNIESGQDHSMFITETGKVFACGWGTDGQLGDEKFETSHIITQVKGDIEGENIIKVSCTSDCILALNDKGEVFGWGNTEYNQLNEKNNVQQLGTSKALSFCQSLGKIVDVASGGSHCLVVNDRGEVFAWGYGILGMGPEVLQSHKPLPIPTTLFSNDFIKNNRVEQVVCGLSHSAAITSNGELFMWGRNKHGCLGFGHLKDQFFPLRTSIGAHVLKVSCGVDHTIALCKPFV